MSTTRSRYLLVFFLFVFRVALASADPGVEAAFDAMASAHGGAPAQVRLITDNMDAWYARWYIVDHAQKTIDAQYFIVDNDIFGRSFLGLLYKKAKEGVKVRLMVDARGTRELARTWLGQDILQEMTENPNLEVRVYNPIMKAALRIGDDVRQVVASNHDKLLVVDGEWLITGGRNIAKHYMADIADEPTAFRDTDVLLHGGTTPQAAHAAFEEEWVKPANTKISPDAFGNWVSRSKDLEFARRVMQAKIMGLAQVDGASAGLSEKLAKAQDEIAPFAHLNGYAAFQPFQGERSYPVVLLDKHSLYRDGRNDITENICNLCDAAEREILIENPYVVLTDAAKAALKRASDRGVDIVMNTNSPGSTDVLLTQAIFVREWKQLMKEMPKLRIFAVERTHKLHAKVFVFDRKVAVIGTYNLDSLSEQVNGEDVAVVKSSAFATMNHHRIMEDMKESVEYQITVGRDGSVEQVVGPSDHVEKDALEKIQGLGWLAFLRPVI